MAINFEELKELSDKIYDLAEVEFETQESAKLIADYLEKHDFTVERNVAGLSSAFVGTYGTGKPVIAVLGEYDALDGIGHACGHNLLGVGSLYAVQKIKDSKDFKGTIKYVGCPAEESGYGKAIMVEKGVFKDIDFALTWHPHHKTEVWTRPSLGVYQTFFSFKGISSHAALSPEMGRSALDAAELMNIGVNYLREHVSDDVRIHYSYLDVGGKSPNVIQSSSKLNYFVRAASQKELDEVQKRVVNIAKGAALMSDVELVIEEGSSCKPFVADKELSDKFAEILNINTPNDYVTVEHISTDVGDVSQVVPTAQVFISCEPYPYPMHSKEWLLNGKTELAYSGIKNAGETIAILALELILNTDKTECF